MREAKTFTAKGVQEKKHSDHFPKVAAMGVSVWDLTHTDICHPGCSRGTCDPGRGGPRGLVWTRPHSLFTVEGAQVACQTYAVTPTVVSVH